MRAYVLNQEEEKFAAFTAAEERAQTSPADNDIASSSEESDLREAQNCASHCYRCYAHVKKPTKTGFKTPLAEFHCNVGRKSVFRAIRQVLLPKILTHVMLNKSLEEGRVSPEKRFRQGCLSFSSPMS